MDTDRLINNIIEQIKEAQLKLGFAKESIRLYYPAGSLGQLLQVECQDAGSKYASHPRGQIMFMSMCRNRRFWQGSSDCFRTGMLSLWKKFVDILQDSIEAMCVKRWSRGRILTMYFISRMGNRMRGFIVSGWRWGILLP